MPSDSPAPLAAALATIEHLSLDDLLDGTLADLAGRLDTCDRIVRVIESLAGDLAETIAERMETDETEVEGLGWLVRQRRQSVSWDHEAARAAVRGWLLDRLSVDRFSGEVRDDWRLIADETWTFVQRILGFGTPKRPFTTECGFDVDEFRAVTPAGWRVDVVAHPNVRRSAR